MIHLKLVWGNTEAVIFYLLFQNFTQNYFCAALCKLWSLKFHCEDDFSVSGTLID